MDLSVPRTIVELGPGEGCHTREIARKMHPESRLLLFEIDDVFCEHLRKQNSHDPRIEVVHTDAVNLPAELAARGIGHCDYVVSGLPFTLIDLPKKKAIVEKVFESLAPEQHAAFIIYQVSTELKQYAKFFPRVVTEYCLQNLPPIFVMQFFKVALPHGSKNGKHAKNGKARF